jgi:hypothetical protein
LINSAQRTSPVRRTAVPNAAPFGFTHDNDAYLGDHFDRHAIFQS